jgi:hypothetical protein
VDADALLSPLNYVIIVSDQWGATVNATLKITVLALNQPPIAGSPLTATVILGVESNVDVSSSFLDPDGAGDGRVLNYTLLDTGLPAFSGLRLEFTRNSSSGSTACFLVGAPTSADMQAPQPLRLSVIGRDPRGAEVELELLVTVERNNGPYYAGKENAEVPLAIVASPYLLDLTKSFLDVDGEPVSISVTGLPPNTGLRINTQGQIVGVPILADAMAPQPLQLSVTGRDPR